MTHIIILSHFICVTIGSILFYELFRNLKLHKEKRVLVSGIGIANISFILDTINIYCRHWYNGYILNDIMELLCIILFFLSFILLFAYYFKIDKKLFNKDKRLDMAMVLLYLFCFLLQIISNSFDYFFHVPWICLGYIFFCGIQFVYLFLQKEDTNCQQSEVNTNEKVDITKTDNDSERNKKLELLTVRENEIVTYVCAGKSNKEIADILFISQNTVRNHIYNIYKKVGVKNKIELINALK